MSPRTPGSHPDSSTIGRWSFLGPSRTQLRPIGQSARRIGTPWPGAPIRRGGGVPYHRRLAEIYRFLIQPGQRVLELGCGTGDLLAALEPSRGVGVDMSPEAVATARRRHPELIFVEADVHELAVEEDFDYVVLSDLVNDLWDVQTVFERVAASARPKTRIVLNFYSRLWQVPLKVAGRLGLATPVLEQNWLTAPDVKNLLYLAGLEPLRHWPEVLWPSRLAPLDALFNRFAVKLWPVRHLALTNFLIARPVPVARSSSEPIVSVIVPARNEAGNIEQILERTPELGGGTELVFVEGHSTDDTYATVERALAERPERRAKLLRQTGRGKGDAVRLGFAESQGEVLMILDADLTVPPEDLPRFYRALVSGQGEYVNGVRLVYPMEDRAMRFLNLLGNKFFSVAFSWLLGQPIKDTLCGDQGALARRLREDRPRPRLFRRLRPVWRLRPHLRCCEAQPQDGGPADPLPREDLRYDQHRPLASRMLCSCACLLSRAASSSSCEAMLRRAISHPLTRGLDLDDPSTTRLRRLLLEGKPFLRRIYEEWYAALAEAVPEGEGRVLELGSGAGFLERHVPDLIRSEILPVGHVSVILDGQALPFRAGSLKAVVMTNVFHHVPRVEALLEAAAVCVRPGGVLAMIEPWRSGWSRLGLPAFAPRALRPPQPGLGLSGRGSAFGGQRGLALDRLRARPRTLRARVSAVAPHHDRAWYASEVPPFRRHGVSLVLTRLELRALEGGGEAPGVGGHVRADRPGSNRREGPLSFIPLSFIPLSSFRLLEVAHLVDRAEPGGGWRASW